jgi:hypothetical protein
MFSRQAKMARMIVLRSSFISACVLEAALIRAANADSYVVQKCHDAALKSIPPILPILSKNSQKNLQLRFALTYLRLIKVNKAFLAPLPPSPFYTTWQTQAIGPYGFTDLAHVKKVRVFNEKKPQNFPPKKTGAPNACVSNTLRPKIP